jgi:hypothetical protein
MDMRWLLLLLSSTAFADVTPPAPRDAKPEFCTQLIVMAPFMRSARDIELVGNLKTLGKRHEIHTSEIAILDEHGKTVHVAPSAFLHGHLGNDVGQGFSSNGGPALPDLPPGRYRARWTVDGALPTTTTFTIGEPPIAPVIIEPLEHSCGTSRPTLAMHVRNWKTPSSEKSIMDLLTGLESSVLVVDGVPYKRRGVDWDGPTNLDPGRWWSTVIGFDEYGVPPKKGTHRVSLEFGRIPSATVDVTE